MSRDQAIARYGTEKYTGWPQVEADNDFKAKGGTPGSPTQTGGQTAQDLIDKTVNALLHSALGQQIDQWKQRATDFDANNPFAFDEVLATQSAQERLDPYYKQQLGDFLNGINTQRQKGVSDNQALVTELNADANSYSGEVRQKLNQAINTTDQNYNNAGLYSSGARMTSEGQAANATNASLTDYLRGNEAKITQSNSDTGNLLKTLQNEQTTQEHATTNAEGEAVQNDVKNAQDQASQNQAVAKQQYVGDPFGGIVNLNLPGA